MILSVTGMNWVTGSFGSVKSSAGDAGVQLVNICCGVCHARGNNRAYDPSAYQVYMSHN